MATWGPLVILVPVWVLATFAPGMLVVRRWRWGPVERLCAAAAVSLFMVYLAAFAVFLLGWGWWAYLGITVGCVVAAGWCWRDWVALWRVHGVRRAVGMLAVMLLWGTLCQAMTRHYSGGLWSGDWYIHFHKIGVFLNGGPANDYELRNRVIERPGMMTLIGTYFIGLVGRRFDAFQLVYTWLNVLSVLPCALLAGMFARRGGRRLWVVAAMLACLPMLWVNATYSWTKLLAAFYVMLGIALYLRSLRKGDWGRMVVAFGCLAAGILVHLVAMPYAAFVFGHYVLMGRRQGGAVAPGPRPEYQESGTEEARLASEPAKCGRGCGGRRPWWEMAAVLVCGALVMLTWYGWVELRYGAGTLLASNSTLQQHGAQRLPAMVMKMARNFVWTMFPHPVMWRSGVYEQANRLGFLRDYVFLIYQSNLPLVTGSVSGVAAAVLAYRRLRLRGKVSRAGVVAMVVGGAVVVMVAYVPWAAPVMFTLFPNWGMLAVAVLAGAWVGWVVVALWRGGGKATAEVWFWRGLIVALPVLGAIAIDVPCEYGYGHIFYHPWAMMGVTLVAVHVCGWPGWVRGLVAAGMFVDFALGVWLQFYLETWSFAYRADGTVEAHGLHMQTGLNWADKVRFGFTFVGDRLVPVLGGMAVLLAVGGIVAALIVAVGCRRANLDRGGRGATISG